MLSMFFALDVFHSSIYIFFVLFNCGNIVGLNILEKSSIEDTSRSFKSFITAVEKSNNGFVTQWGDGFAAQFKNKRFGGVFGYVESEYNGKVTNKCELRWFCADDKVDNAAVPTAKTLPNTNKVVAAPASNDSLDGFLSIPDGMDEDVPF
jgi:hypothetical protein